ncbi:MAG: hypothetical protein LBB20_01005 [Puniceicoccales bacterium]|jgi:hypothetical protein|nr:hypothetical protein [Puniceicoccales bacterium]
MFMLKGGMYFVRVFMVITLLHTQNYAFGSNFSADYDNKKPIKVVHNVQKKTLKDIWIEGHLSIQKKSDLAVIFKAIYANDSFNVESIDIVTNQGDVFASCGVSEMTKQLDQLLNKFIGKRKYSMFIAEISGNTVSGFKEIDKNDKLNKDMVNALEGILNETVYYKFVLNILKEKPKSVQEKDDKKNNKSVVVVSKSSKPGLIGSFLGSIGSSVKGAAMAIAGSASFMVGTVANLMGPLISPYSIVSTIGSICLKGYLTQTLNPNGVAFSQSGVIGDQLLTAMENQGGIIGKVGECIRESKIGMTIFSSLMTGIGGKVLDEYFGNVSTDETIDKLKNPYALARIVKQSLSTFKFTGQALSIDKGELQGLIKEIIDIASSNSVGRFYDKNNPEYKKSRFMVTKQNIVNSINCSWLKDVVGNPEMNYKEALVERAGRLVELEKAKKLINKYRKQEKENIRSAKQNGKDTVSGISVLLAYETAFLSFIIAEERVKYFESKIDAKSISIDSAITKPQQEEIKKNLNKFKTAIGDRIKILTEIIETKKMDNLEKSVNSITKATDLVKDAGIDSPYMMFLKDESYCDPDDEGILERIKRNIEGLLQQSKGKAEKGYQLSKEKAEQVLRFGKEKANKLFQSLKEKFSKKQKP